MRSDEKVGLLYDTPIENVRSELSFLMAHPRHRPVRTRLARNDLARPRPRTALRAAARHGY